MSHKHHHHRSGHASRKLHSSLCALFFFCLLCLLLSMLPYLGGTGRTYADGRGADIAQLLSDSMEELKLPPDNPAPAAPAAAPVSVTPLRDTDLIAPVPDPAGYGTAEDAGQMLRIAADSPLLREEDPLFFGTDRSIKENAPIRYYMDDSILAITWKEVHDNTAITFAEIRIADASQFRRFLAEGRFGGETQITTTEMAQTVNAVLASSGDFYRFRYSGIAVYEGLVRRVHFNKADTCCINADGDLYFLPQDLVMTEDEAQKFVEDNRIRFSLTFGPILVQDHQRCEPDNYDLGEVNSYSPRAALCQMGPLHYLLATSNSEDDAPGSMTIHRFAELIASTGCEKAYALDGGQTAAIALDGKLVNRVLYGQQRPISDIIYFATAVRKGK